MKDQRLTRIGILFQYDENWIGGTYYLINLISALNQLEENEKPNLLIFSNLKDYEILRKEVIYTKLNHQELNGKSDGFVIKLLNHITLKLVGKQWINTHFKGEIDALFPFRQIKFLESIPVNKRIYWIPDFQEKHLPQFYSDEHLDKEVRINTPIVMYSKKLVLSSYDSLRDLKRFYPEHKTQPYVIHFASRIPKTNEVDLNVLLQKFSISLSYFFAPNQFWKHKNHIVVIKALEKLKQSGVNVLILFSGKEYDSRHPGYTESLKEYVRSHNLEHNVRFLGFIDRNDQLQLMKHSLAVIQPSLFEGWSTVIEEAMAYNKTVIASDLEVNKEQLGEKGIYFERENHSDLADKIKYVLQNPTSVEYDYKRKQIDFAKDFLNCVNDQQ